MDFVDVKVDFPVKRKAKRFGIQWHIRFLVPADPVNKKMCLLYNFSHVLDAIASFSYILFHIGDNCDQFKMGTTSLNRQRPVNNFSLI